MVFESPYPYESLSEMHYIMFMIRMVQARYMSCLNRYCSGFCTRQSGGQCVQCFQCGAGHKFIGSTGPPRGVDALGRLFRAALYVVRLTSQRNRRERRISVILILSGKGTLPHLPFELKYKVLDYSGLLPKATMSSLPWVDWPIRWDMEEEDYESEG